MRVKYGLYIFNETQKFKLKEQSKDTAKVLSSLEQGKFVKIICGAANTNEKHVERLAFLYALSGVDVIDVAPEQKIINAANAGLENALNLYGKSALLMVSINAGDDLHFRKAEIDMNLCTNCKECVKVCPVNLDIQSCFGCGKCETVCLQNAIKFTKLNNNINDFSKFKAIEIHTGNNSIKEVKDFLELNEHILKNAELLSFSVESKRFNENELITYVNSLVNLVSQKIIIQVDGIPMSGSAESDAAMQAISSAKILSGNKINAYIQIAGGANFRTKNLAEKSGVKISGIGYGTFARKIILSYIEDLDDSEFLASLPEILNITTNLVGF